MSQNLYASSPKQDYGFFKGREQYPCFTPLLEYTSQSYSEHLLTRLKNSRAPTLQPSSTASGLLNKYSYRYNLKFQQGLWNPAQDRTRSPKEELNKTSVHLVPYQSEPKNLIQLHLTGLNLTG